MKVSRSLLLLLFVVLLTMSVSVIAQTPPQPPQPPEPQASEEPSAVPAPMSPDQLQQLVAPIALYPDSLVAQILAASTYPTQIVEAERWLQQNQNLQGQDLANAVNQQSWDPSVKALAQFPSVLANMDQNLSWTQSLGDAYYNQAQDVMDAIQVMRQKAQAAGNLQSTPQQTVTTSGPTIEIAPANPDYVYVPTYDPWLIYGDPIPIWPGFVFGGIWVNRPFFGFGIGINIGFWRGFGWGWPAWGFDWRARHVVFGRAPYLPHGPAFFDHRNYRPGFYRAGVGRGPIVSRGPGGYRGGPAVGFRGSTVSRGVEPPVGRGFGTPRGQMGTRSSAFNGFAHGGVTSGYAARGVGSMGGGARMGGGGGARGGGGGRR